MSRLEGSWEGGYPKLRFLKGCVLGGLGGGALKAFCQGRRELWYRVRQINLQLIVVVILPGCHLS